MAIDYENTSFAFNRRREFVNDLRKAKGVVEQRLQVPGRESVLKLAQLLEALNHVLADEAFADHVAACTAEGGDTNNQPATTI